MRYPVEYALEYAARGLQVLPLKRMNPATTHPMLRNEFSYDWIGTTDPQLIRAWWGEDEWYRWWEWEDRKTGERHPPDLERGDPAANIGVVTGARSGVLVLDVDRKRGDGWASLVDWCRDNVVDLTGAGVVETPSHGLHVWLRLPPDADPRRKVGWLPNVDACGSGGFVAMPPSAKIRTVSAPEPWAPATSYIAEYEWLTEAGTGGVVAPQVLVDDIASRPPSSAASPSGSPATGDALPETVQFESLGLGWYTGSRNTDLYKLLWRLMRRSIRAGDVLEIVRRCYDATSDKTDFPWSEVEKTMASARARYEREPGLDAEMAKIVARWRGE